MERIAVYGAGTIGSCQATLIIGNGLPCTVIGHSERGAGAVPEVHRAELG